VIWLRPISGGKPDRTDNQLNPGPDIRSAPKWGIYFRLILGCHALLMNYAIISIVTTTNKKVDALKRNENSWDGV
jgi:hypothetical protein